MHCIQMIQPWYLGPHPQSPYTFDIHWLQTIWEKLFSVVIIYGPRPTSIFVASGGLIFTNHNQVFNILRIKTIHILPTCDRKFILLSQVYSLS